MAQRLRRPHRPHLPDRQRGAVLGRRRHRAGDLRHHPRRRRHRRQRHPRADRRVGAAVLRHRRQDPARCLLRHRARRRLRRVVAAHPRGLRRGHRRVGAQRHQDVDHQRRHRRRPRAWSRPVDPELKGAGPGLLRRPARHPGPHDGPEVQEARHPRLAHRRGRARRRARARPLPARRQGEARRAARPGPRGRPHRCKQAAMATFEATRPIVGAQALGIARAAYEYSLDYAKERQRSAGRSSRTRASRSSSPT